MKIKSKKKINYKGKVFDLKVKGSHSYNIEGLGVHNSGVSSLINYLLGITLVDPLKYDLIFERFISPSRKELPDIDNDVELKDESFQILKEHFGKENVLAISNYNRLQLKSLVKDIAKLYGVPFQEANEVTKTIETEAKDAIMSDVDGDQKSYELTYENAKKYSPTFAAFINKYPEVGSHISNLYRQVKAISKHAGGVCIVPDAERHLPIINVKKTDQSPVSEGMTVQHLQEHFGVPKFDILGLATLRIIRACIENILISNGNYNPKIEDVWKFYRDNLDPSRINTSDEKVLKKVYHKGKFLSTFQFEDKGVQNFCQKAKPTNINDIAAITSIWRPGALKDGGDQKYIDAKKASNKKKAEKEHPIIKKILGPTRMILCFQEQFMQLANELAGFSMEEANTLRKILVKMDLSKKDEIQKARKEYGEKFISGCIEKGVTKDRAEKLWNQEILSFIAYGFNASHAYAYAFNSYQCAWLNTYYEREWVKACLENDPKPEEVINVVRGFGYKVQKHDINKSLTDEWLIDKKIAYPSLVTIKGIGLTASDELVEKRNSFNKKGFKNIEEFLYSDEKGSKKWRWSKLNKKAISSLIQVESFESLKCVGEDKLFKNYKHMHETIIENYDALKKMKITIKEAAESTPNTDWNVSEKIEIQKKLLGFYDKELLLGEMRSVLGDFDIDSIDETEDDKSKGMVWIIVEDVKERKSKNGNPYISVSCSGLSEKKYYFKVWKQKKKEPWTAGNILVVNLEYSDKWGYNLVYGQKPLRINK